MEMHNVSSKTIQAVGYDANSQILQIKFRGGGLYRYFGVPVSVFDSFINAESLGRYYNKFIRGTRFKGERISLF